MICKICGKEFTEYPEMRPPYNGAWCKECQDDFDSIDWDEINEKRLDNGGL